jgi:glutamine amidotransferase
VLEATIVNYGVGNLHSISKALARCGAKANVTSDIGSILSAKCIVFPGVGAFGPASRALSKEKGRVVERLKSGIPALGICLGMQLFCDESEEASGMGLGLIPGRVRKLNAPKVPHVGWTRVNASKDGLFDGIPDGSYFYFVHSYIVPDREGTVARARYGEEFAVAVRVGNTYGVQFHPEKSSTIGLKLVDNFVRFAEGESR